MTSRDGDDSSVASGNSASAYRCRWIFGIAAVVAVDVVLARCFRSRTGSGLTFDRTGSHEFDNRSKTNAAAWIAVPFAKVAGSVDGTA